MEKVYFRYKEHPGDLFRNTEIRKLPDPQVDLEGFLIWFLNDYQSDDRIALLDDYYKILNDEFSVEEVYSRYPETTCQSKDDISKEIKGMEKELLKEAYENFYTSIYSSRIEIIGRNEI